VFTHLSELLKIEHLRELLKIEYWGLLQLFTYSRTIISQSQVSQLKGGRQVCMFTYLSVIEN
jgi:hypothetical protein